MSRTNRLFPAVGEAFVSNRRRPLLELVADDSPGAHDMLIAACDGRLAWLPAATEAGASLEPHALLDTLVVLSACPQDLLAINGSQPTSLAIELHGARIP